MHYFDQNHWHTIPYVFNYFAQRHDTVFKSNQTLSHAEYNKCRPYREMLTYKPLTNSAVQEELRTYLPNKLKKNNTK